MTLETAQILSTVHRLIDNEDTHTKTYRVSHEKHPSVLWVKECREHYLWTYFLFAHLSQEYSIRYKKVHKSWMTLGTILSHCPKGMSKKNFQDPPQCMPEKYRQKDTVQAYRKYYIEDKRFAQWKYCPEPYWWYVL